MRSAVLLSLASITAVAATPTRRQANACATECDFEQEFCTFRESPACQKVCNAATYNKWVACHDCQLEAGNADEAEGMKNAIARLSAGCLSTGNGLEGGQTSALSTATGAPAGAVVEAATESAASPAASASASGAAASAPAASGSGASASPAALGAASGSSAGSAAASASAPAATPSSPSGAGRVVPAALLGFVGAAATLFFA